MIVYQIKTEDASFFLKKLKKYFYRQFYGWFGG